MAILGTNDGGVTALQDMINSLTQEVSNLTSQLGNYNTSTLEGSQSITALNDRISLYNNAIKQYQDIIKNIGGAATEAKIGSAQKQLAKQGYITGMATKRGQTSAEALKDMADIEAVGKTERADIRQQEQENLGSARGGLSNLYMEIAKESDSTSAGGGSSGSGGGGSGLSSALSSYASTPKSSITQDQVDSVMGNQEQSISGGVEGQVPTSKKGGWSFLNIYKILPYMDPGPMGMVARGAAVYNIFKKLNK